MKTNIPEKAYRNIDFLTSQDARIIRILAEFLEPKSRFNKFNIVDTIVFFGSARLVSKRDANKALKKFQNSSKTKNKIELKRLENLVAMSKYYEDAAELSERITRWSMNLTTNQNRFIV